ncbi:hypothetical protein [Hydrogenophaga soli]|nr:hypothetical protein [Burkholderiaceae bacterium]
MLAIKKARKLIAEDPTSAASQTLADLVVALEAQKDFSLHALYELDMKRFELALEILKEWRLDRYYASKLRLLDASAQALVLAQAAHAEPPTEQTPG